MAVSRSAGHRHRLSFQASHFGWVVGLAEPVDFRRAAFPELLIVHAESRFGG